MATSSTTDDSVFSATASAKELEELAQAKAKADQDLLKVPAEEAEETAVGLSSPKKGSREEAKARREREKAEARALREERAQQKARLAALRKSDNADIAADKDQSVQRRLDWLSKQASLFSFFSSGKDFQKDADAHREATKAKKGRKKKSSGRGGGNRMTEEEEDSQMLAQSKSGVRATRLTVQPNCIKYGTMRDYQIEGLNWLISLYDRGINGILADEMGLGKTLQTISILGYLHEARGVTGPHMVIVPKTTVSNWQREFARWCPILRVVVLDGPKDVRQQILKEQVQLGCSTW